MFFALALPPATLLCQTGPGTVPAGTPLTVRIEQNTPMRAGEPVSGRLLYPIYADNRLLLPKDTVIRGEVVSLHSDHNRRVRAVMGGDFTPFHTPVVHFTEIKLSNGRTVPFRSGTAGDGAPVYRAVARRRRREGLCGDGSMRGSTRRAATLLSIPLRVKLTG